MRMRVDTALGVSLGKLAKAPIMWYDAESKKTIGYWYLRKQSSVACESWVHFDRLLVVYMPILADCLWFLG